MRTLVKIVGGLVALVVLVIGGTFVWLSTVDWNQYKGLIAEKAKEATGRELQIKGDLKPVLGLSPKLAVSNVTFANAEWGEKRPMAAIGRFEAQLQLLPLVFSFGQKIVVDRVALIGADILLQTDARGRGNWEMQGAAPAKSASSGAVAPSTGTSSGAATRQVAVNDIELRDVKLEFRDGQAKTVRSLALESLLLRGDGEAAPRTIAAAGKLEKLVFKLDGKLGSIAQLTGAGAFPLDLALDLGGKARVTAKGSVREAMAGKGYDVTLGVDTAEIARLGELATDAGFALAIPALGPLKLEIRATDQAPHGRPSLPKLSLALGGADTLRITAEGEIKDPLAPTLPKPAAPGARIKLDGATADLAKLAQKLGQQSQLSGPFKLAGTIADQGADKLALSEFKLEAAGSDIGGDITLTFAKTPMLVGNLRSNKIDLTKFAGESSGSGTAAGNRGGAAPAAGPVARSDRVFPDDPLPLDKLGLANADVKILIANLVLPNGMQAKDNSVALVLKDGSLAINQLKSGFGGGAIDGKLTLSSAGALATQLTAKNINLGTLIRQASGADNFSGGSTEVDADLRSNGISVRQIMAGLNGRFALTVGQGAIKSAYLDKLGLDELMKIIDKSMAREESVRVNCIVSRIDVAAGVATHRVLVADTARLTLTGGGRTNLGTETLDMRADTKTKVTSLLSVLPPILIKGSFVKPRFEPDLAAAAAGALGALANTPGAAVGGIGNLGGAVLGAVTGQQQQQQQQAGGGDICATAMSGRAPAGTTAPAPAARPQQPSPPGGIRMPNPFQR
jgi:uncharacterized protein involved in outer membrane biogenesis